MREGSLTTVISHHHHIPHVHHPRCNIQNPPHSPPGPTHHSTAANTPLASITTTVSSRPIDVIYRTQALQDCWAIWPIPRASRSSCQCPSFFVRQHVVAVCVACLRDLPARGGARALRHVTWGSGYQLDAIMPRITSDVPLQDCPNHCTTMPLPFTLSLLLAAPRPSHM